MCTPKPLCTPAHWMQRKTALLADAHWGWVAWQSKQRVFSGCLLNSSMSLIVFCVELVAGDDGYDISRGLGLIPAPKQRLSLPDALCGNSSVLQECRHPWTLLVPHLPP